MQINNVILTHSINIDTNINKQYERESNINQNET